MDKMVFSYGLRNTDAINANHWDETCQKSNNSTKYMNLEKRRGPNV